MVHWEGWRCPWQITPTLSEVDTIQAAKPMRPFLYQEHELMIQFVGFGWVESLSRMLRSAGCPDFVDPVTYTSRTISTEREIEDEEALRTNSIDCRVVLRSNVAIHP